MMKDECKVLWLKFVGIDDFSCPIYQDQFERVWKDINLGNSENPDLYSVTGNALDGEPLYPMKQKCVFKPEPYKRNSHEFTYMMLSRMQMDCDYFLGYGRRSRSILSEGDPEHHINRMKELWKELPQDGKPEWLTWDAILDYEKAMCSEE